jgi:putative transposase
LPGYAPAGTPNPASLLTLGALDQRLRAFLLDDYHYRVHGETGVPPRERWEASGFLPNLPESLAQLDLLLLSVAKPRTVQQDGIHFQGLRYLDLTLAAYVGEPVVIRYDPADLAEIRVYHHHRFLCRAICQELADQQISLTEIVRARTQRRKQVRDDLKERTTMVDQLLLNHHAAEPPVAPTLPVTPSRPRLKRYVNE